MRKLFYNDKFLKFLESHFIKLSILLIITFFSINKVIILYSIQNNSTTKLYDYLIKFDNIITQVINPILVENNSALISIAAVFIGIYFTIFTILSGFKTESTFAVLNKEKFRTLVIYIKNAFIGSFLYLFFSLIYNLNHNSWILNLLSFILLYYMLASAIRFAVLIYLILQKDIEKYHEFLEAESKEKMKQDDILNRMKHFLDEQDDLKSRENNLLVEEKIKNRNK